MLLHHQTPTLYSYSLSQKLGKDIWFKMDCHQPTGSFKVRGVGQLCVEAKKNGSTKFVIASGGNAGLATAYAGNRLSIPTTVIVPSTTLYKKLKTWERSSKYLGTVGTNPTSLRKVFAKKKGPPIFILLIILPSGVVMQPL